MEEREQEAKKSEEEVTETAETASEKQTDAGTGQTEQDVRDTAQAPAEDAADASENADAPQAEGAHKPDAKDVKIEELTDKYKRLFAEFDNYRKRTDAEKSGMYADGQRSMLEKILPIIDNFERAAGNVPEELKDNAYVQGIEKVCRSTMDTLKGLGVEPIEAVGKEFDANLHNAVMHVEDETYGENIVADEFQKGYTYKGKVIRYSMVKVAN
ncbi:MAG: nucleotide exchange factor GrpE [Eubacteriales bacterium]|nr:nucleotide exchange factor GrpE [Eubacteriales bacterium]